MAVNVSYWRINETTIRLRLRVTGQKDFYRFIRGSEDEARAAGAAWQADVETRGRPPASPSLAFGAWLSTYLATQTALQPTTRDKYAQLAAHLASLARRPIGRLTIGDGMDLQVRLLDDGVGAPTVGAALALAKRALAEATRLRILPHNPFDALRPIHGIEADVKFAQPRHVRALRGIDHRAGRLLRLAAMLGARRCELLALIWDDFDLAAGTVTIQRQLEQRQRIIRTKPPKSKAGRRTISIPPQFLAELQSWRAEAGQGALAAGRRLGELPVIADADGVSFYSPMAASQAARRALAAESIPGSLHGLRHAHATMLLSGRVNPREVQRRIGHARVETTLHHYGHHIPADDGAAAALIGAAFDTSAKAG